MSWRSNLGIGLFLLWIYFPVFAEEPSTTSKLGKIKFPTSGSFEAQRHFTQGVAALHSFWYKEALAAFRRSTKVDPGFVMGYWGEAMAYNYPLWEDQDTKGAQKALAKIKNTTGITDRERAYLNAVQLLYGKGKKPSRDKAYADAMAKIHREYPNDLEAACFYSLSLLGIARNSADKLSIQLRAGEIGQNVFRKNPDHPCAAHYTIHAFDHPDLAIRALPAAQRYAKIAPASPHAQHMPAHIFLQLGMWSEAATSNEAGWQHSVAWVERKDLSMSHRDYHSLQWLHYVYLQQGRYEKANQILQLKLNNMMTAGRGLEAPDSKTHRRIGKYLEQMFGASVFERERWDWVATFKEPPSWKTEGYTKAVLNFVRGFAAAIKGQPGAEKHLAELKAIRSQGFSQNYFKRPEQLEIWELEIQAAIQVSKKNYEEAIALMIKAVAIEEKLPAPSGPPRIIKPTHELFGELFLRSGKPMAAAQQFAISLFRHPNRFRSLLGAARAKAQQKDMAGASKKYAKFLTIWKQADPDLPELNEARNYLEKYIP